jgi:23S rRNA (pseudouridine1915-N3)-methyltransferase
LKLLVLAIGRAGRLLEPAIAEYQTRAARYWTLDIIEVKEERARAGLTAEDVKNAEAERLLKRVPRDMEMIALTRTGDAWTSERLARHIERTAVESGDGIAFIIGGSLGLGDAVLRQAQRRMRLSTYTFPHDLARLILLEQLYRAGTIVRNEPYHKGSADS